MRNFLNYQVIREWASQVFSSEILMLVPNYLRTWSGFCLVGLPFIVLFWLCIESGLNYGLFKFWIFSLVGATIFFVVRQLKGERVARWCFCGFVTAQSALLLFPLNSDFDLGMLGWRPIDEVSMIKAQIPTHRKSEKWDEIRKHSTARPYLYFSISTPMPQNDVLLSVNGQVFNFTEDYNTLLKSSNAGGFALPLNWSTIDQSESLEVQFDLKNAKGMRFFTGFYPTNKSTPGAQEICVLKNCVATEQKFDGTRFVLEVRVADENNLVLGILY